MQTKPKDLRTWQGVTALARALDIYPARVYQIQDEYDLFDVRDATPDDKKSPYATKLDRMWRLKDGAVAADVTQAHLALKDAGAAKAAPASPRPHRHTPEKVEAPRPPTLTLIAPPKPRAAAVKVRVTHVVEPLPFEVSSPEELAQALLALARAVYPDTKTLALHLAGVTYDAKGV